MQTRPAMLPLLQKPEAEALDEPGRDAALVEIRVHGIEGEGEAQEAC